MMMIVMASPLTEKHGYLDCLGTSSMTISISQLTVSDNYSLMLLFFNFFFHESVKRGLSKGFINPNRVPKAWNSNLGGGQIKMVLKIKYMIGKKCILS